MNTLKKFITALTLSTLGFAFTTSATPIYTEWDFIVDSAFTSFAYTAGDGATNETMDNILLTAPTILAWGDQVSQSSLDISSGSLGNVTGDDLPSGTAVQTALLIHNNISIPDDSKFLDTATLSTLLQLVPANTPFPAPVLGNALAFDILFKETLNTPGLCGGVPCGNDIFIMTMPPGVIFDGSEGTLNQQFSIFEHTYNIELKLVSTLNGTGLSVLHNDICDRVAGADADCIGLTTIEGQSNEFQVMMTITYVPEPSTILLLSLALFGIVASMKNKHI